MARKDLYHNFKAVPALAPAVTSAAGDGLAIDTAGFDSVLFVLNTGAIVSAGDFGAKMQESDVSGSGYTDVAADDIQGAFPSTLAAASAYRLGYVGDKRFVRLTFTKAGGTSIALSATAVLGHPHIAPVA